MGLKFNI